MGEKEYCEEYEKEIENSKEAKYECLVFQVLEEHVEKDKKHFEPCQDCIRLGITKGYQKAWKQALTLKLKELDEDIEFMEDRLRVFENYKFNDLAKGKYKSFIETEEIIFKQKLAQKISEKEEVNKIYGETK